MLGTFGAPEGTPCMEAIDATPETPLLRLMAAALLAGVKDADRREGLLSAFQERVAVCEVEAGLSPGDAERVAYEELTRSAGVSMVPAVQPHE